MPSLPLTALVPRFTQLADWLAWQETLHPKVIDLGLERVRAVAARLDAELGGGLLAPKARTVLIAGTNGKGSCVASLTALVGAAGGKVGCYTSPHLLRYNERIAINGQEVSDADLCRAFAAIDRARGEISLSYFEFGTLAAYWLMAQAELDVWVIEVGLGGRLDATNILDADIAIITSIALDHEAFLGNTRELIAAEKFGIVRPQSCLICAELDPPESLKQGAARLNCPAAWAGRDFSWSQHEDGAVDIRLPPPGTLQVPHLQLPIPSVAAALMAFAQLGYALDPAVLVAVLSGLRLAGRWQRFVWQGVDILLDVAHNPASTQALAAYLAREGGAFVLLMGMMADKNIAASLKPLNKAAHLIAVGLPTPRAAAAAALAASAQALGFNTSAYVNLADALPQA
ncbi:MAG TPA: folylpolyglutamate synthase/dihydrofolate synthase family protein, partial [Marinagarivorans sp.]|nr:folylpolyglutamate synthase/dihydrofolate synthase family protein [Marinagarivorans sp.]